VLQDNVDFSDSTFDTNVNYSHFCSAYREIVHVEEPVEWDDAVARRARGGRHVWSTPTIAPAGGPLVLPADRHRDQRRPGLPDDRGGAMQLVDDLKRDLENRPEFEGAEVEDKLGAALPTRRPYDSAVHPGYMAIGDAAGHVNPTTGGGIAGAAYGGKYAAEQAIEALETGDYSEDTFWAYNEKVMDHFGARYAALDVYNILSTAVDVDDLMGLLAAMPGDTSSPRRCTPAVRISGSNSNSRPWSRVAVTGEPSGTSTRPSAAPTNCSPTTRTIRPVPQGSQAGRIDATNSWRRFTRRLGRNRSTKQRTFALRAVAKRPHSAKLR